MKKIFVLDTNILLSDPRSIFQFEDNVVIIPIAAIEEIDQFKKDINELGRNARMVARNLDELRKRGSLSKGIPLNGDGLLRIDLGVEIEKELALLVGGKHADNQILAVALRLKKRNPSMHVVLITKDTNLRIKADAFGLEAQDYQSDKVVAIDEVYTGLREVSVEPDIIDRLYREKWLGREILFPTEEVLYPNEYFLLRSLSKGRQSGVARYDAAGDGLVPLSPENNRVCGISPRNLEQSIALDLLLDDEIKLVTLLGKAGTGKTLLALAAGFLRAIEEGVYHKLLVSRPVFPLGRDIGFLPGEINEKLKPWMQPIFDNLEFILSAGGKPKEGSPGRGGKRKRDLYDELIDQDLIEIEPLTYIRGRSIPYQFLIVDEAQNLTPLEVKTIISRAGSGTKIVLTGDPYQIDHPYLDANSNGLVHVVE
ncbi:MAG: PhoH family protein, partial [Deltaproteobacteria bacterium]